MILFINAAHAFARAQTRRAITRAAEAEDGSSQLAFDDGATAAGAANVARTRVRVHAYICIWYAAGQNLHVPVGIAIARKRRTPG